MKTTQQIVGLPVISISDGNEIGKVKNVIINAAKGTVDFFIIDSGARSLAGGVIPAGRVLGIGEYALTIQEPDDISDIVKIPAAIELLQKNITVSGTRVLTKKGSLLGEAGDIYINEDDNYGIIGVEFIPDKPDLKNGIIPRSSIITFGKNLLVVDDNVMDSLTENLKPLPEDEKKNIDILTDRFEIAAVMPEEATEPAEPTYPAEVPIEAQQDELFKLENEAVGSQHVEETVEVQTASPAAEKPNEENMSAAELFEYRQKQYLLGKKVSKNIYDASGSIIASAGEVITDYVIDAVKREGKLIELVMNYEE
jgi:uncharacterized protein YrrD